MDNVFKSCPAVMSDGRIFTDWTTSIRRNEYINILIILFVMMTIGYFYKIKLPIYLIVNGIT